MGAARFSLVTYFLKVSFIATLIGRPSNMYPARNLQRLISRWVSGCVVLVLAASTTCSAWAQPVDSRFLAPGFGALTRNDVAAVMPVDVGLHSLCFGGVARAAYPSLTSFFARLPCMR